MTPRQQRQIYYVLELTWSDEWHFNTCPNQYASTRYGVSNAIDYINMIFYKAAIITDLIKTEARYKAKHWQMVWSSMQDHQKRPEKKTNEKPYQPETKIIPTWRLKISRMPLIKSNSWIYGTMSTQSNHKHYPSKMVRAHFKDIHQ